MTLWARTAPGLLPSTARHCAAPSRSAAGRSALHVVTAFVVGTRVTIGQVAAGDKESEITAARTFLGLFDLTDILVTGDALHCQGETARLIEQRGGKWLFTLKANRPLQHAEVAAWFADPKNKSDGPI